MRLKPQVSSLKPQFLAEAWKDGQVTDDSDNVAYGCCGQALTRFTSHPPAGPGRLSSPPMRSFISVEAAS